MLITTPLLAVLLVARGHGSLVFLVSQLPPPASTWREPSAVLGRRRPGSASSPGTLRGWLLRSCRSGTYQRLQAELEDLKPVGGSRSPGTSRLLGRWATSRRTATTTPPRTPRARWRPASASSKRCSTKSRWWRAGPAEEVAAGVTVRLRYVGDDEVERYFVGSIEERHADLPVISPRSPLGQALMGKRAGDTVTYEAPSGQLAVEVVGVGD